MPPTPTESQPPPIQGSTPWRRMYALILSLWPTMIEAWTSEQAQAWQRALATLPEENVIKALRDWYEREADWPVLGRISAAARPEIKPRGTYRPEPPLTERDKAAYRAGLERMREIIERRKAGAG